MNETKKQRLRTNCYFLTPYIENEDEEKQIIVKRKIQTFHEAFYLNAISKLKGLARRITRRKENFIVHFSAFIHMEKKK